MLDGAVNVLDYVAEDYMVLANYIQSFPVDSETGLPTISEGAGYDDVNGIGRITILDSADSSAEEDGAEGAENTGTEPLIYTVAAGDCLWKIAVKHYQDGYQWTAIYESNKDTIRDPNLIFAGQMLIIP